MLPCFLRGNFTAFDYFECANQFETGFPREGLLFLQRT